MSFLKPRLALGSSRPRPWPCPLVHPAMESLNTASLRRTRSPSTLRFVIPQVYASGLGPARHWLIFVPASSNSLQFIVDYPQPSYICAVIYASLQRLINRSTCG